MNDLINNIIENLTESLEDFGTTITLPYKEYEAIPFSKDLFKEIKNAEQPIAFIDGGNTEILKAANFSLQYIRIYYTIYSKKKRIKNRRFQFYLLIQSEEKDGITYTTKTFGDQLIDNLTFNSFDQTIIQGTNRADISQLGNVARRFAELSIAEELTEELQEGSAIVLDGNLDTTYTGEDQIMQNLRSLCKEKNITLAAVAKTCELFTDAGASIISALKSLEPDHDWVYEPIAKTNEPHDILFAKLHKNSTYLFRIDIIKQSNKEVLLGTLKQTSTDPVFLGYPYPLIEADKFARVSNKEQELLRTEIMMKAGKHWKSINNALKTKDSHHVLDTLS